MDNIRGFLVMSLNGKKTFKGAQRLFLPLPLACRIQSDFVSRLNSLPFRYEVLFQFLVPFHRACVHASVTCSMISLASWKTSLSYSAPPPPPSFLPSRLFIILVLAFIIIFTSSTAGIRSFLLCPLRAVAWEPPVSLAARPSVCLPISAHAVSFLLGPVSKSISDSKIPNVGSIIRTEAWISVVYKINK